MPLAILSMPPRATERGPLSIRAYLLLKLVLRTGWAGSLAAIIAGCMSVDRAVESETSPSSEVLTESERKAALSGRVDFFSHIKPILEAKCVACHGGSDPEGTFSMAERKSALSETTLQRIVPGHPLRSPLIRRLDEAHAGLNLMPPVGNRVTSSEQAILRRWIAQGAEWPGGSVGTLSPRPR